MQMTEAHRSKTGAYYTPPEWAALAVTYMKLLLPEPLEHYTFFDPAAGEGALLDALPEGCDKYAATLEAEDVAILLGKGYKAQRADFFEVDLDDLPLGLHTRRKRLVVFMNPPYFKLAKDHAVALKETYGTNDSVALFLYRTMMEICPAYVVMFGKLDLLQGDDLRQTRRDLISPTAPYGNLRHIFVTSSKTWQGLKGQFPIGCYFFDQHDFGYYRMPQGKDLLRYNLEGQALTAWADRYEEAKRTAYDQHLAALDHAPFAQYTPPSPHDYIDPNTAPLPYFTHYERNTGRTLGGEAIEIPDLFGYEYGNGVDKHHCIIHDYKPTDP